MAKRKITDNEVRQIRAMYAENVRARAAGEPPKWTVRGIAELFETTPSRVYLIGNRLERESVPDDVPPEPTAPAVPLPATVAKRKARAAQPKKTRRYPSKRDAKGRFTAD